MSRLSAFLNPAVDKDETKEVIVSKRFLDEEGNPLPFVIRALTQAENESFVKLSTKKGEFNKHEYTQRVIVAATVDPDFATIEMRQTYSPDPNNPLVSPLLVPGQMLLAGEYARLGDEILEFSGFGQDLTELAKN